MKVFKKTSGGVGFVRKESYEYEGVKYEADIKNGDIIKILDGGNPETGKWGEQTCYRIKTRNGEKKIAFNPKTINVLIEAFGDETDNWVGKEVRVLLHKTLIAGEKAIVPYFVIDGWKLDEYGELIFDCNKKEINLDSIPF
ncbi:MAG: hypothetical protein HY919_03000 [Elusimicrobia bacterium]|nr:hypothetical protein [Elusimicrobiota bacterium]